VDLPKPPEYLPAGPALNRLVATLICGATSGMPDETYPAYSTDPKLAFEAVDIFLGEFGEAKLTIEYPVPEVWIKMNADEANASWVPVAFTVGDTLPHALCLAILKAKGHEEEILLGEGSPAAST